MDKGMIGRWLLLLLLLLPLAAAAQPTQSVGDDSGGQPPGSVAGRVTNVESGDGISGATIRLIPLRSPTVSSSAPKTANSQADGGFLVEDVPPGTYLIIATQSNFAAGPIGAKSRPTVNVSSGETVTDIAVQLTPFGRIRGKVLNDEAQPVQGATVEAFLVYSSRGETRLRRVSQVATDEHGNYTLKAQQAGRYYIAAQPENEPIPAKTDDAKATLQEQPPELVRTLYPKSLDIENATPVDLVPGQDTPEATIQLVRAAAHHVRGRIEGLVFDGRPHGPILMLAPRGNGNEDGLGISVAFHKDGTFDIPKIVSGSYTLSVTGATPPDNSSAGQSRAMSRVRLLAKQDVDVGAGDVNGIVLTLIPLATLSGHVTVDGSENTDLPTIQLNFVSIGASAGMSSQNVQVQRDGSFEIQNVAPGRYMVRLMGTPSGTYVRSITYNRQDVTTSGIDLTQGGGGEIEAVLRSGSGEVDGTLDSLSSIPATAVMLLVPETLAADGSGVLIANLQSPGGFVIRNVPPGRYFAYATDRWSPLWQNPDFLRTIQNQGASVDLPENGHAQVQLSVITSDQVQAAAIPLGLSSQ